MKPRHTHCFLSHTHKNLYKLKLTKTMENIKCKNLLQSLNQENVQTKTIKIHQMLTISFNSAAIFKIAQTITEKNT